MQATWPTRRIGDSYRSFPISCAGTVHFQRFFVSHVNSAPFSELCFWEGPLLEIVSIKIPSLRSFMNADDRVHRFVPAREIVNEKDI